MTPRPLSILRAAFGGTVLLLVACSANDGVSPAQLLDPSRGPASAASKGADGPREGIVAAALGSPCADVLTQGYEPGRRNAQTCETALTPGNLIAPTPNQPGFGKLYSRYVRGRINAQPLVVNAVSTNNGPTDMAVVATMQNEIYAFDPNDVSTDPNTPPLWHTTLAAPANVDDMIADLPGQYWRGPAYPHIGVMGTPVIDRTANGGTGLVYLVAFTESGSTTPHQYDFLAVALNLRDGSVVKSTLVPRTVASDALVFRAENQNQRPGLLLQNGIVYAGFASAAADANAVYTGWIIGFKASDLSFAGRVSMGTNGAGIWQSGAGLAGDPVTGDIFAMTGNGHVLSGGGYHDVTCPLCDGFVRLPGGSLNAALMTVTQQSNDAALAAADIDLSSAGPMVLPDHRVAGGGKTGIMHVFATASAIGGTDPAPPAAGPTSIGAPSPYASAGGIDTFKAAMCDPALGGACADYPSLVAPLPHLHSRAYWNDSFFVWGERSTLRRYAGTAPYTFQKMSTEFESYDPSYRDGAGNNSSAGWMVPPLFAISANGNNDGIVWSYRTKGAHVGANSAQLSGGDGEPYAAPGTLLAIKAATLETVWSSDTQPAFDALPSMPRLAIPTISNGRVFVGTWSDELTVYGLGAPPRATSGLPPGAKVSAAIDSAGTWAFATDNQGRVVYRLATAPAAAPSTGLLSSITANAPLPLTVPGAPIAAAYAANHISLFYVDTLGRIVHVYRDGGAGLFVADNFDTQYVAGNLANERLGVGGRGTAPPGAPVSALAFGTASLDAVQVGVVGHTGQPLHWQWVAGYGWSTGTSAPAWASKITWNVHDWTANTVPADPTPSRPGPVPGFALQRTPLAMMCRTWPNDCEVYFSALSLGPTAPRATGDNSTPYNAWRPYGAFAAWYPGTFLTGLLPDRAPLSVVSRTASNEDVFWVQSGQVNRATWSGAGWSSVLFSSAGMLPDRTVVAAADMNAYQVNLLAVDGSGAIKSQWSTGADAHWNAPYLAWSAGSTSAWQTYAGAGTAASPIQIVPNWPAAGNLDLYYVNLAGQIVYQHHGGWWWAPTAVSMP